MRHAVKHRKFNRNSSQRKALLKALAVSLITHEQISTTLVKAKEMRGYVERLITFAKKGDLASRRRVLAILGSKNNAQVKKLFDVLAKRYEKRPGGYTRVLKAGFRHGDYAPMAIIELVDRDESAKGAAQKAQTEATELKLKEEFAEQAKEAVAVEQEAEKADSKKSDSKTSKKDSKKEDK